MRAPAIPLSIVLACFAFGSLGCGATEPAPPLDRLSVADLLGAVDASGFERASDPRTFRFPRDHGPHPGFRTEWWYFTGNLATQNERRFGYQLTFFRTALTPTSSERSSRWAADLVYMAHFAVTDVEGREFRSRERFARGALGLAGARASHASHPSDNEPARIWLEDWSASVDSGGGIRLRAEDDDIAIDLRLDPGKPPVLHGDAGLSRKGAGEGNASYYYSLTRMPTTGTVTVDGVGFEISGLSWMDREWSTSVLEEGQVGWDWLSLQLSDGTDLMVYRIRRRDGSSDPHSTGTLVAPDGESRNLPMAGWGAEVLATWTSPETGIRYPTGWRLLAPSEGLELEIRPLLSDQEMRHSFLYWEGAVSAEGSHNGRPIDGHGYIELTGYGSSTDPASRGE